MADFVLIMLEPEKMRKKTPVGQCEEMEQVMIKSEPLVTSATSGRKTSPALDVTEMLGC